MVDTGNEIVTNLFFCLEPSQGCAALRFVVIAATSLGRFRDRCVGC
jgi:hypothetical protein